MTTGLLSTRNAMLQQHIAFCGEGRHDWVRAAEEPWQLETGATWPTDRRCRTSQSSKLDALVVTSRGKSDEVEREIIGVTLPERRGIQRR